jgi:hypothetical protein
MSELGASQVGGTGPHNLGTSTFFLGGLLSKGSVVLTRQFALRRLADGLAEPFLDGSQAHCGARRYAHQQGDQPMREKDKWPGRSA